MTRQKKTRREAGRVPAADMVDLIKERGHPSQSKLKPKQRSVYESQQQLLKESEKTSSQPKRKNRLKTDPSAVAEQSRQLLDQADNKSSDSSDSSDS